MATWSPISNSVPQFSKNAGGAAASDYYLKFYLSGTTTPTSMATDSTGGTLLDKCKINSLGYPVNGSDEVFIPHIDQAYKLALYTNATDADNNATGSAAWVVDGLTFVSSPITAVATLIEEQTAVSDGQALFTLLSITYTPGAKNLGVYRNGTRLPQSSYTETSSTSITLNASEATSIVTGDEFEFIVNERDVSTTTTPASNVTYTPEGTGAVATDVQTELRKAVLVNDVNAIHGEDGKDVGGFSYIRLRGGDFTDTRLFPVVKKDGTTTPTNGNLTNINLTAKPYSATIGTDDVWLLDIDYYHLPANGLPVQAFWVHADDETVDDVMLQAALDYQRDRGCNLSLPAATIKTVKPMVIWCNDSESEKTANPRIFGAGRGLSVIRRNNRLNSTLVNHTSISAVLIIANDFTRDGNTVTTPSSTETACYFGTLSGVTLKGDSPDATRVAFGWYSLGLFYWDFDDVEIEGCETACATEHWNVFCNYRRLEMQLTGNGCDFGRTDFGGNSNMYFEECHANGINGFCYSILSNATMIGCTIDGGGGKHYVIPGVNRGAAGILGGRVTLIDCKSESQATFDGNPLFDINYGQIDASKCSIEIPTLNYTATSRVIECSNYSKFVAENCAFNLRVGGPTLSPGSLYSIDVTSRVNFDSETFIDTEWFDQYKKVFYRQSDKRVIGNRDKNGVTATDITKFIYIVSGAIPAGERTVTNVSFASNRIQVDCVQANGHTMANGIMFNQPIDLTDYSKIYIQGDNTFVEGEGVGVNYQVYINSSLIADGSVGAGTPLPMDFIRATSGEVAGNFNDTDFDRYVDIRDINGIYYIGIELFGVNIDSNIQEISLLR